MKILTTTGLTELITKIKTALAGKVNTSDVIEATPIDVVTSVTSASTDSQLPTAKAVYQYHDSSKQNSLTAGTRITISGSTISTSASAVSASASGSSTNTVNYITINGTQYKLPTGGGTGAVDSVNGKTGTVVLTATDVNALPDSTSIPSKTSDLTNDSGFITSSAISDMASKTWVGEQGFLTSHQSLAAYRTSANQDAIDEALEDDIDAINAKIPNEATSSNQLADKAFVNSSIATETAHYISNNGDPFTSVAQLEAYTGTVTNNDYAIVTGLDIAGNSYYDRYKASVSGSTVSWAKEYRLNNSSFTAVQWSTINSGMTSSDKTKLDGIEAGAEVNVLEGVQINGTDLTIDENRKVNIPVAASGVLGVVAVTASYGLGVNSAGALRGSFKTLAEYADLTEKAVIAKGTLENLKVTSSTISASSTDTQIPTAKCVWDICGNIEATLQAIRGV